MFRFLIMSPLNEWLADWEDSQLGLEHSRRLANPALLGVGLTVLQLDRLQHSPLPKGLGVQQLRQLERKVSESVFIGRNGVLTNAATKARQETKNKKKGLHVSGGDWAKEGVISSSI
jgi:hypothetical protein